MSELQQPPNLNLDDNQRNQQETVPLGVLKPTAPPSVDSEDIQKHQQEIVPPVMKKSIPPPSSTISDNDVQRTTPLVPSEPSESNSQLETKPKVFINKSFASEEDHPENDHPNVTKHPNYGPTSPNYPNFNGYANTLPDTSRIPYSPGYRPSEFGITDLDSLPDVNVYQHKKTLAQGMMDVALFSANANQFRYVMESSSQHPYYYPSTVMISISLILQVAIGVGLIWNCMYNVKNKKEICIANKINNFTVVGIFVVTAINVFICSFGIGAPPATAVPP